MKKSQRKIVVLTSLVALLTTVGALLLALAPPPLSAGYDLAAADRGVFLDDIFKTAVSPKPNHWQYVYVHQSASATGNADTLAVPGTGLCDHFVIGNGNGCQDGEIQMGPRWNEQQSPAAPPGVDHIEPSCISVCLIGDFDHSMPTPAQLRRLAQLVSTLQSQFRIASDKVILLSDSPGPSSVGRYFPVTAFRDQILP